MGHTGNARGVTAYRKIRSNNEARSIVRYVTVMITVIGVCDACGSVMVNDKVCDKFVPSLEWLKENGYEFEEAHNIMHFYCCDACVNHYRVDYCACGSGEDYRTCECDFFDKVPMYELEGPGVWRGGWLAR